MNDWLKNKLMSKHAKYDWLTTSGMQLLSTLATNSEDSKTASIQEVMRGGEAARRWLRLGAGKQVRAIWLAIS